MLKTNEQKLAKLRLQGSIAPPIGYDWETGHDGRLRVLPGLGGITLNFKVGDLANGLIGDHLEPGVSSTMETGSNPNPKSGPNRGYNTMSCIGNEAVVLSGAAKGKKGVVTGHHGGPEHVIIDFDDATLHKLTYDDKIMITGFGVGLAIEDYADKIALFALSPELLGKMNIKEKSGKIEVPVAALIPACVMGSGLGSSTPFRGDYDIQTSDPQACKQFGLDKLRLGDIVAIIDHDSSYGWCYRQGAISIGVIIHGDSTLAGHGPGCQTIMTSPLGAIVPKLNSQANIGNYLKIGRYRKASR